MCPPWSPPPAWRLTRGGNSRAPALPFTGSEQMKPMEAQDWGIAGVKDARGQRCRHVLFGAEYTTADPGRRHQRKGHPTGLWIPSDADPRTRPTLLPPRPRDPGWDLDHEPERGSSGGHKTLRGRPGEKKKAAVMRCWDPVTEQGLDECKRHKRLRGQS